MQNRRVLVATSAAITVALMGLAVTCGVAVVTITRATEKVSEARGVVTPYLGLQRAVSEEAMAEASYRRAPSPEARRRIEIAIIGVGTSVKAVRGLAKPRDAATLSYLELLNNRYVTDVRDTLDSPISKRLAGIDNIAGPALEAIMRLLDAAITGHRADAQRAADDQARVIRRLSVVLPGVFVLAFSVLIWTWRMMLLNHRRLRGQAAESENRALTDALTGLPNRDALQRLVEEAIAQPESRASLLFIDLDRFKPVNDTLGHHAGDMVLQQVASRLRATVRAGDMAARFGGDEFAVFLPQGDAVPAVAGRILSLIEQPFVIDGKEVTIGASIGVARYPQDGNDFRTLLQNADSALYAAKQSGRGRVRDAQLQPAAPTEP